MTLSKTDADILDILTEGRNLSVNIAEHTKPDRTYITKRLKKLEKEDYVKSIGVEKSGLYEITDEGHEALDAYKTLNKKRKQIAEQSD